MVVPPLPRPEASGPFFETYTRGLSTRELERLFTFDAPEAYRLFSRHIDVDSLKQLPWHLRAVARRSVNREGDTEGSFYLQLELNGLASVGSSADAFLERTIRGYSRETAEPGKITP